MDTVIETLQASVDTWVSQKFTKNWDSDRLEHLGVLHGGHALQLQQYHTLTHGSSS